MKITKKVANGTMTLSSDLGDELIIPLSVWGHPNVRYNGNVIPSAKMWDFIGRKMANGEQFSTADLMDEARRADMYRFLEGKILVWTLNPRKEDKQLEKNVYIRRERNRIRPLVERFNVVIAKLTDVSPLSVKEMIETCKKYKYKPFAMGEDRILFSRDVEKIFDTFGTRDWVRLYVYFKRPGATSVDLNLSNL